MTRLVTLTVVFAIAAVLAGTAWMFGFATALEVTPAPVVSIPANTDYAIPENFALFQSAWGVIRNEFYGTQPEPAAIASGSVRGLLGLLNDPYAAYLSAEDARAAMESHLPVPVASVGAWLEPVREGALVVAVIPGSAARAAEMAPGDTLLMAGRDELAGIDRARLVTLLDGAPGSPLELTVYRRGQPVRSVELTRTLTVEPLVSTESPEAGVAVLRISRFGDGAAEHLASSLEAALDADSRALVIDLRDNPGGDLDELRKVAAEFMTGTVWTAVDGAGETAVSVDGSVRSARLPSRLVVLVNGGTAYAAEILAAALQANLGAVVVGEPTFGWSTLQEIFPLSNGDFLRLTVAEWRTPAGQSVADGGLVPDREVAEPEEQMAEALRQARAGTTAGG